MEKFEAALDGGLIVVQDQFPFVKPPLLRIATSLRRRSGTPSQMNISILPRPASMPKKRASSQVCFSRLIQVLLQSGFRLRATELYKDVSKDRGELGSVIRTGIRKVIAAVPPDFDQDGVQQHINKVREWAVGGLPQVYYLRALHSRSCGSGPTCTRGDHQVSKPVRQNTLEDTHGLRWHLQRQISRCGDYASCVFRS